jgi:MFS family permease
VIPVAISIFPLLVVRELENNQMITADSSESKSPPASPRARKKLRKIAFQFAIINIFIGLGAGFVIPYLNVFFWDFYNLPTAIVGIVQGLGSLSVAIGVFLSPVLSTRIGKVKTVIATQALSLPFLLFIATIINPYVAIASYILRVVFMNAAGPVDNTFRMEMVPESFRANMSAISSFAWNFPWAISTRITGPLFDLGLYLLPFWFTLTCYCSSTMLYAVFFWKAEKQPKMKESDK